MRPQRHAFGLRVTQALAARCVRLSLPKQFRLSPLRSQADSRGICEPSCMRRTDYDNGDSGGQRTGASCEANVPSDLSAARPENHSLVPSVPLRSVFAYSLRS
jgi:hypothetical protein